MKLVKVHAQVFSLVAIGYAALNGATDSRPGAAMESRRIILNGHVVVKHLEFGNGSNNFNEISRLFGIWGKV